MPAWRLTVGLFGEFPNAQWEYPNATYERQQEIVADFKQRALGLLKFFTVDLVVPAEARAKMATFGLCRDEYNRSEHWMSQLYVRTALRMVGRRVLTQQDVVRHETLPPTGLGDSIGVGAYVPTRCYWRAAWLAVASLLPPVRTLARRHVSSSTIAPVCLPAAATRWTSQDRFRQLSIQSLKRSSQRGR